MTNKKQANPETRFQEGELAFARLIGFDRKAYVWSEHRFWLTPKPVTVADLDAGEPVLVLKMMKNVDDYNPFVKVLCKNGVGYIRSDRMGKRRKNR